MDRKKREHHARRERRKNAGLCMRCENPRTKGNVSCAKCRAYSTENQAQLREHNGIGRTPRQKRRRVALEESIGLPACVAVGGWHARARGNALSAPMCQEYEASAGAKSRKSKQYWRDYE